MTDAPPRQDQPHYWTRADSPWRRDETTPLRRFLGGAPLVVAMKLAVVSLIVGALLVWLDIRPTDVVRLFSAAVQRLYDLGFASVRAFGDYMLAGALIVVPTWLVLRLLSYRGR